ncbi:MAG: prolyl oligopeptidase family serine peptidase [Planctomycetes bacterium]|nr:prolyl oligopeptidase family serine peptidase [Planctomycetota bacterium]
MQKKTLVWCNFVTLLCVACGALAQESAAGGGSASPQSGLLLTTRGEPGGGGRRGFGPPGAADPLSGKVVDGTLARFEPKDGQSLEGADRWVWKSVAFNSEGVVEERGSWLYVPVDSEKPQILILNASGQGETYVNGEPRGTDIYGTGFVHLPVLLHEGTNRLFFRAGRGAFKVRFYPPPSPVSLHGQDLTLPDLVVGQPLDSWGAAVVVNATPQPATGFTLSLRGPGLIGGTSPVPTIIPLTVRKVGFAIRAEAPAAEGKIEATLELRKADGALCHSLPLSLEVVGPTRHRKVTFVSDIDGSVQYFGLRPATAAGPDDPAPAIVLSCHGAGVEAQGQAGAYGPKSWFHIVAPTNRRPYGYDWEDFGRMDAMEVLSIAQHTLKYDPSRVYLTGHSMGGHGAWHLGVTYPDRFAAVAPSAGWPSRSSYGGRRGESADDSSMGALLARCRKGGDTAALSANLKQHAVYILHGGSDDNVPPGQARTMAEVLEKFHHDWIFHEEPGMGHWWGGEADDGGTACVDWPEMFDLFARHALPPDSAIRRVEFVTANPGVSSRCHWLAIEAQTHDQDLSKADVSAWPNKRRFKGTTENVDVLRLDVGCLAAQEPIDVELDGQTFAAISYPAGTKSLWFAKKDGEWLLTEKQGPARKGPHRYGPVKDELKHRFLFVYGTRGTPEENAWALAKARFDAETFWYRGNGSVEIVQDVVFSPSRFPDRTVILYGNADTNSAWTVLLAESPVQVRRGQVRVGDRTFPGEDLSTLFVRPRPDSDIASVVVVGGSGPVGMRAIYPVSVFVSAVRYPDCLITRPGNAAQSRGSENVAVGFFGNDWSVAKGEFAFADREESPSP